jgi:hypothetical protein
MTGPVSSLVPLSKKFCTILIPPWDTWFLIFIVEFLVWYNVKKMLGHAPSKKEIPTLNQNDIP